MTVSASPTVAQVKIDAKQRTLRSLLQGAIATIVVSVLPIINTSVSQGFDKVDWHVLEVSAVTAGTMALISYVMAYVKPAIDNAGASQVDTIVEQVLAEMEAKVPQVVNNVVAQVPNPPVPDLVPVVPVVPVDPGVPADLLA